MGRPPTTRAIIDAVFAGETGPRRDVVLLNAGAALVAAGVAVELEDGVARARAALDSGRPAELLERLRAEKLAARVPTTSAASTAAAGSVA